MPSPGSTASATKCRSRSRSRYPRRAPRGPAACRRSTGRVSGSQRRTARPITSPSTASATKTARHPATFAMTPPTVGANRGATPMMSMRRDSTRAAVEPAKRSRTTAIATTVAAALPTPCSTRNPTSGRMPGATAHSTEATMWTAIPISAVAPGILPLVGFRVLQGVGNAAATVVAMAVVRDRFAGSTAARVLSRLLLIIGVAPLFAPTVGGVIANVAGWRAVFVALAVLGLVIGLAVLRWLPETLPVERRHAAGPLGALRGYRDLLRDRHFVALAVLPGLGMAVLMSYVAGSPYVLRQGFGLSANQFSVLFAINGLGLVAGAQLNGWLVHRVAPIRILRAALPVAILLALTLLVIAHTGAGGLIGLLMPLWFLLAVNGLVPPNASALALTRHGERAGTAAALIGSLQAGVAGVVST